METTATLNAEDLKSILDFTISLARTAGALILDGSQAIQTAQADASDTAISAKKNAVDLVTEYDVKVEELVKSAIAAAYPTFAFVGEESYSAGSRDPLTDVPTFCVDPIDGTTNFVHGFPFVCISLGLIYRKRPVLGVIYNPFLNHLYHGITGQGSFLTRGVETVKLPIGAPKPFASLSGGLLAVEWGSDRTKPTLVPKADSFLRLAGDPSPPDATQAIAGGRMAHSLRSVGSAALNFSLVAQGALDLYWEIGCWPWDVCAGIVIAQEAGCMVTGSTDCAHDGDVTEEILTGRKYLVIRGVADTSSERGVDAQKRLIRDFYDTVADVTPN